MKNLEFKELSNKEILEINGGGALLGLDCATVIAGGLIVGAVSEIFRDWDNFKAGLAGGPPAN